MANKYIELVKKWMADNSSVTLEELKATTRAARDAAYAANADAAEAADAADAAYAAYAAAADDASNAAYWVKKYEELTNDK